MMVKKVTCLVRIVMRDKMGQAASKRRNQKGDLDLLANWWSIGVSYRAPSDDQPATTNPVSFQLTWDQDIVGITASTLNVKLERNFHLERGPVTRHL